MLPDTDPEIVTMLGVVFAVAFFFWLAMTGVIQ